MDISFQVQIIVNGLVLGFYYALVGAGFTLVFGICRIFNFAHGELYMLGGFATYYLFERLGINYPTTVILVIVIVSVLGIIMERIFYRPVYGTMYASFMVALGLQLAISGAALVIFGEEMRGGIKIFPGLVNLLGATVTWERLAIIFTGAAVVGALLFFIHHTKTGREFRAVAQNPIGAALQGIDITRSRAKAFMISAGLAGVAAVLVIQIFYVDAFVGGPVIFKAMTVVILGGLGSIPGAIVGGLTLGMADSVGYTLIGHSAEIIIWAIVILVLLLRPRGILGKEE